MCKVKDPDEKMAALYWEIGKMQKDLESHKALIAMLCGRLDTLEDYLRVPVQKPAKKRKWWQKEEKTEVKFVRGTGRSYGIYKESR